MRITDSSDYILRQVLSDKYRNKTILDYVGVPFKVACVRVENDSPDPGWQVWFDDGERHPQKKFRCVNLGEPLPEIWPYEVPVSPAS